MKKNKEEQKNEWPVFMFKDWSFHCNERGEVVTIYKQYGEGLRCIMIDDSTGECIVSVQ